MSNSAETTTSREEEIAFLAMEQVLGINIQLADAGGGNSMPDGAWSTADGRGIVEVTSPPAADQLAKWASSKRANEPLSESGVNSARINELAAHLMEELEQDWATENIKKLQAQSAEQRHLYLFARTEIQGSYFYRLSDEYNNGPVEQIANLELPCGITNVWFQGRAQRVRSDPTEKLELRIARYQSGTGWHRHVVVIDELALPSPNSALADDPIPPGRRKPKRRTESSNPAGVTGESVCLAASAYSQG
ncbi:hypothetical protein [Brevibacterium sp. FAM 24630]|uniref:hypothetical protein n=1 Tax=Brevibacterium sp. FAM 24630 TaxID=3415680 RepID=UPI003C7DF295